MSVGGRTGGQYVYQTMAAPGCGCCKLQCCDEEIEVVVAGAQSLEEVHHRGLGSRTLCGRARLSLSTRRQRPFHKDRAWPSACTRSCQPLPMQALGNSYAGGGGSGGGEREGGEDTCSSIEPAPRDMRPDRAQQPSHKRAAEVVSAQWKAEGRVIPELLAPRASIVWIEIYIELISGADPYTMVNVHSSTAVL